MPPSELKPEYLATLTTLVVEDNKFMRGILGELLRQIGFAKLHFAADGLEGIELFRTWLPKIVFTDWNMPVMNGVEFVNWVRNSPDSPNPETPMVMITGNNQHQEILEARDAGVTEFIAKPVTVAAIMNRLNSCLLEPRKFVRSASYVGPCRRRRKHLDYHGPKRRLDDPLEAEQKSDVQKENTKILMQDLTLLNAITRTIDLSSRKSILELRQHTERTSGLAQKADDAELAGAATSLLGYIDAFGATGGVEREIVDMHLSAMNRITDIADEFAEVRERVVTGLKKVVEKKLHEARMERSG